MKTKPAEVIIHPLSSPKPTTSARGTVSCDGSVIGYLKGFVVVLKILFALNLNYIYLKDAELKYVVTDSMEKCKI